MQIKNVNQHIYKLSDLSIPNLAKQKFLVFDLEATGFNIKTEYVTQIGCVPVINGKIVKEKIFCSFIYSPKKISPKISKLTGIKNKQIENAPKLESVLKELCNLYKNYIWLAQCGFEFDFPLLDNLIKKLKIDYFKSRKLDTKVLFTLLHPEIKNTTFSTNFLKKYYEVKSTDLKRHNALGDSILVARILEKLLQEFSSNKKKDLIIKEISIKKFIPKPLH